MSTLQKWVVREFALRFCADFAKILSTLCGVIFLMSTFTLGGGITNVNAWQLEGVGGKKEADFGQRKLLKNGYFLNKHLIWKSLVNNFCPKLSLMFV